jgi:hypothetical protein
MGPTGRLAASLLCAAVALAVALVLAPGPAAAADTWAPSAVVESPLPGALFNQSGTGPHDGRAMVTASIVATDNDTAGANLSFAFALTPAYSTVSPGEGFDLAVTPLGGGAARATLTLWLPDGRYTLDWTVTDLGANEGAATTTFLVDLSWPTVTVTLPAVSTVAELAATIDIVDTLSGVDPGRVTVYFRSACNASWSTVPATLTEFGGHVVGEVTLRLCEGQDNLVQVAAFDRAGHGNSTGTVAVTHDGAPPTLGDYFPRPFTTVNGPRVNVSVRVTDNVTGVDPDTIELQVSTDGGATWGPWTGANATPADAAWTGAKELTLAPGTAVAVRWRASDNAGNGIGEGDILANHFHTNGPPFLITYEPAEGIETLEGRLITFSARFADPDADIVRTSFYSDKDGYLGELTGRHEIDPSGDSFTRDLSLGTHNITIRGDDGHGNRVDYTYEVHVVPRPPPDLRPFAIVAVLAAAMVAAAWVAWRRAEEMDDRTDEGG